MGGAGGSIQKRPTFAYNSALDAWQPNIDIISTSVGAPDICKIGLGGSIGSALASNANVFTKMDSSSLNFGDNWRFRMHITGDVDTPLDIRHDARRLFRRYHEHGRAKYYHP